MTIFQMVINFHFEEVNLQNNKYKNKIKINLRQSLLKFKLKKIFYQKPHGKNSIKVMNKYLEKLLILCSYIMEIEFQKIPSVSVSF